jgi:hypothetical protein
MIGLESGAYTAVREHFEPNHNAAIGQEMTVFKPILIAFTSGFYDSP